MKPPIRNGSKIKSRINDGKVTPDRKRRTGPVFLGDHDRITPKNNDVTIGGMIKNIPKVEKISN